MLQQKRIIARLAILSTLSVLATSTFTTSVQASMPHPPSGALTKDIVITATKTKENIRLVSQSVEVITAKDIEKLGATNVTDIFAYTFGVDTSRSNHGTALQIRGLSSSHTLFLIDGERISGEDTPQLANTKVLQRINISEIDRIEIVRGTGSSLYGSDAIGGIINIITKQSNQKSKTILSYGAGTKRTMSSLHTNFGTTGTFLGTLDWHVENQLKANNPAEASGIRRNYCLKGSYHLPHHKNQQFDLSLWRMESALTLNSRTFKDIRYPHKGFINTKQLFDNSQNSLSIRFSGKTNNNEYVLRAYTNTLHKHQRDFAASPQTPNNFKVLQDTDTSTYTTSVLEGKNTTFIGNNHNLTIGFEVKKQFQKSTRIGNPQTVSSVGMPTAALKKVENEFTNFSHALYVEDIYKISDQLWLFPSLRYEHNHNFGNVIIPKLGLTYNVTPIWKIKANVGKGFKAPTVSELHMNFFHHGFYLLGNPDLKPEYSISYDISLEGQNGTSFIKMTYFNNHISNLIDFDFSHPIKNAYKYQNINAAQINGIEMEIGTKISEHWTGKLQYNWNDAIDAKSKHRLHNRAEEVASILIQYHDHHKNPFHITLMGRYTKNYLYAIHQNNKLYSYPQFNIGMHKTWNNRFSLYAGIDNLFQTKLTDLSILGREYRVNATWKL